MIFSCHRVCPGRGRGAALVTDQPISFLGNLDPESGRVVDPHHQLFGQSVAGRVLIFPEGKGSTVGSYVLYQLARAGLAPAAMINIRSEPIVAVGAIIGRIPLVDRVAAEVLSIRSGTMVVVDADLETITVDEAS